MKNGRIYKAKHGNPLSPRFFRIELAWTSAFEGNMNNSQAPPPRAIRQRHRDDHEAFKSIVYVIQNTPDLPAIRLHKQGHALPTRGSDRQELPHPNCILYRYKATKLKDENPLLYLLQGAFMSFCKPKLLLTSTMVFHSPLLTALLSSLPL